MDKEYRERMIFLIEQNIRELKAEYLSLIKKDGKFNKLKEIKTQIRKAEESLRAVRTQQ